MRRLLFALLLCGLLGCSGSRADAHTSGAAGLASVPTEAANKPSEKSPINPEARVKCVKAPCPEALPVINCRVPPCPKPAPVRVARHLYEVMPEFYLSDAPLDKVLSPELLRLVRADQACAQINGMCGIDADPWSAAQDGERRDPVTYEEVERKGDVANVRVCFQFVLDPQAPEQRCAMLDFLSSADGYWKLDDLVSADGSSLKQALSAAPQSD